ncbi:15395_t:CDS:1, partial [Funneliformis geosporum]
LSSSMSHDSDREKSSQFLRLHANLDVLTCSCFDKMQDVNLMLSELTS